MSSTVRINGVTYTGNNIVVSNGKVLINGQDHTPDSKKIDIVVNGNIETLKVDACDKVVVGGSVSSLSTLSGDVKIEGNVGGSISTMSGSVKCGSIGGSVSTMSGDIVHK